MTAIISKRFDNWFRFEYQLRVLDCVASTLHVYSECVAVAMDQERQRFLVSFNSTLPEHKIKDGVIVRYQVERVRAEVFDKISLMADQLQQHELQHMLLNYHLYLTEFMQVLKDHSKREDQELSSLLLSLLGKLKKGDGKNLHRPEPLIEFLRQSPIPQEYRVIVDKITPDLKTPRIKDDSDSRSREAVLTSLIRPLVDSFRLSKWLVENFNQVRNNMLIITNSGNMHAEINMALATNHRGYIGISKLCCKECNDVLDFAKVPHRGCHGLAFPNYRLMIKDYPQFVTISRIGALPITPRKENVEFVNQNRRLSDSITDELLGSF